MDRLQSLLSLVQRVAQKASVRDVIVLSIAVAVAGIIALIEIQTTRRRLKNLLLAQDRQARAMTVLATRLDGLAQQAAQLQHDQTKQREEAPAVVTPAMPANLAGLRAEIERLRKEIR